MKENSKQWKIDKMCQYLSVSRSGYYAWLKRPQKQKQDLQMETLIKAEYKKHRSRYGSIRITKSLKNQGYSYGHNRVAKAMQRLGLKAKGSRKFRITTTQSKHEYGYFPNILNRCFDVAHPNTAWVGDITYIWTEDGWAYLSVFMDLYSRAIVGWRLKESLEHTIVTEALEKAIVKRCPTEGLIVHSDRGVQYACNEFCKITKSHGIIQSMSRKGNCWDNAVCESFFKTLKSDLIYGMKFSDIYHLQRELFEYIEMYYNRIRMHSSLGYMSPMQFENSLN